MVYITITDKGYIKAFHGDKCYLYTRSFLEAAAKLVNTFPKETFGYIHEGLEVGFEDYLSRFNVPIQHLTWGDIL